jgi:L-lactate permease
VTASIRTEVVNAAHHSFIGGLHLASLIAAAIVLLAVVGVLKWLPARAVDELSNDDRAASLEPGPAGATPATVGNLAVALERE